MQKLEDFSEPDLIEQNIGNMENDMEPYFVVREVEANRNSDPLTSKRRRKKPKVVRDWEEEDIFKLIAHVEAEKCLWNTSDEAYHNKTIRDCAWRNIAQHFQGKYTVTDLNAKWTNLRIQFRSYTGRAKIKSGKGIVEVPKWRFYSPMSFVGRGEDQQTQQNGSNSIFTNEDETSNSSDSTATSPKQRPVPSQLAATQIAETMREAVNVMKQRKESTFDPNSTFAKYLLSELKTLNSESAAAVRKQVTIYFLECIEKERMK